MSHLSVSQLVLIMMYVHGEPVEHAPEVILVSAVRKHVERCTEPIKSLVSYGSAILHTDYLRHVTHEVKSEVPNGPTDVHGP